MNWTEEQINSIAPDTSSLKAGKGLATPSKWTNIGVSSLALWGECQGSGANPYKTQIDFSDLAFKCSCPSRKFPCKHSIGILFLLVQKRDIFKSDTPPDWVKEWLESRRNKKAKQEEKNETKKEISPEKKAKTEAQRISTVESGINELELWIKDLIRKGTNSLQKESYNFFKNISSRMIDAKAPGLAKKIDDLSGIPNSGKDWSDKFLEKISSIFLLINSFKNMDNLSEEIKADIKTQIGWNYSQDDILKNTGINDNWLIIAQDFSEENNLKIRKTYLLGYKMGNIALLLDYSFGTKPFDNIDLLTGKVINSEVVYYPSNYPLRALLKTKEFLEINAETNGIEKIEDIFCEYSKALSRNPFIESIPLNLKNVLPVYNEEKFIITDKNNYFVQVKKDLNNLWKMIALSGGFTVDIFGEWNGEYFNPLSLKSGEKYYLLSGEIL